jgi:hypothetical protein
MQLNLFCDNRRTIRLNDAGELLRALRLEEALALVCRRQVDLLCRKTTIRYARP